MKEKFNWQLATIIELAKHIYNGNPNSIKQQVLYYKAMNNTVMIDKINKAKELVTLWKLEDKVKQVREAVFG